MRFLIYVSKTVGEKDRKMKQGFLIDMDGVIYRGSETIPGAVQFVGDLLKHDMPFLFLTNNSQRTKRDIVARLHRMDIDVGEEHVFTSAIATAQFVARQRPRGTAYVIGEGGLLQQPTKRLLESGPGPHRSSAPSRTARSPSLPRRTGASAAP